ncbi:MAG: sugar nucleotide-binding protein [Candidatus Eiseniibacteriota bacterium]
MSTVLVTGASSALGIALIDSLLPAHRVMAMVHRATIDTRGARVEVLEGGLEACEAHAARIRAADVIVHLAAVTHSRAAALYERVNHEFTRRLLAVSRAGQRMVFMSTICAHPEGGAYGASKWRAEQAVKASELPWVIVRPAEVYGAGAGEGIDALIAIARRTRLLPDFRSHGPVRYAPVSCASVTQFLMALVGGFARSGAVYTLCAQAQCTATDIAQALRSGGHPVMLVPVPIGALRFVARLRLPIPLVEDQLDRLVAPKEYDPASAIHDYGFEPGDFLREIAGR